MKMDLNKQAEEILKLAEARGVQSNVFFTTTFKRYLVQIKILDNLENVIKEEGMTVTKEYVKNRKNLYSNPAVKEYNRTTDSANKTVATIMRILKNYDMTEVESEEEVDPLLLAINGEDYE